MNRNTLTLAIAGSAGNIDVALDMPTRPPRGVAVIAHPHPLHGGNRDNKVVQTLARALMAAGFACWRPNFRGVGESAGTHDDGIGETEDMLRVVEAARTHESMAALAGAPLVLAGFSFGTYVQARTAAALAKCGAPAWRLVLIAPAASRYDLGLVPEDTLVVHGEIDDVVPLQPVLDWARPQALPILVVPGAEHFFHGRLTLIKRVVLASLCAGEAPAGE